MYITIGIIFILILILFIPIYIDASNIKSNTFFNIKIGFIKLKLNYYKVKEKNKFNPKILNNIDQILKRIDIMVFDIIKYHNLNDNLFLLGSTISITKSYIHKCFRNVYEEKYRLIYCQRRDFDFYIKIRIRIADMLLILRRLYGSKSKYPIKGKS